MNWPTLFNVEDINVEREHNSSNNTYDNKTIEQLLHELSKNFSRISNKLASLIGTKEFEIEINNLLIDNRGGRKGFPISIITILTALSLLHNSKYNIA